MNAQDFNDRYFGPNATDQPFRSDLTVNSIIDPAEAAGTPTQTPINPQYCASSACAFDLAALLSDVGTVTVYEDFPFAGWPTTNDYIQSGKVPWLKITDANGNVMQYNAGQLAVFFTHGFNPTLAGSLLHNSVQADLDALQQAKEASN